MSRVVLTDPLKLSERGLSVKVRSQNLLASLRVYHTIDETVLSVAVLSILTGGLDRVVTIDHMPTRSTLGGASPFGAVAGPLDLIGA